MAPVWIKKHFNQNLDYSQDPGAGTDLTALAQFVLNIHNYSKTPSVMPFYGNSVASQPGPDPVSVSGFGPPPPLRDRFSGWPPQPGDPGGLNGLASWGPGHGAPQGHGYLQQVAPPPHPPPHHAHQLDELRHYHPQYAAAAAAAPAYHQSYQQPFLVEPAQSPVFQPQTPQYSGPSSQPPSSPAQPPLTPRSNYSQAHTPQQSPNPHQVNGINGNIAQRNGVNGSYLDASPVQSMDYVNGSYTPSQESVMAPPQSTTPNSRSSSVHLESGSGDSNGNMNVNGSSPHHSINGNMNGPKTPSHSSSTPGSGNAMPGYPLHQAPPQLIQQSLHNSSGYPGQDISSGAGGDGGMEHWNSSSASVNIISHQSNNQAGSASANGTTNASANRSVWNGGGQDRPPSGLDQSPSPQHHFQPEQPAQNSNNTSPVNSRLKTMILNKQQQQFNQQMQQYNQQVQAYNQQQQQLMLSPSASPGGVHRSPSRSSEHYGHQSQQSDSRPSSRQSPNPPQNSAGHFLVKGHHLQRSIVPEGGGFWEWGVGMREDDPVMSVKCTGTDSDEQLCQRGFMGCESPKETVCKQDVMIDDKFFNSKNQRQNDGTAFVDKTVQETDSENKHHLQVENEEHRADELKFTNEVQDEPYPFRGDGGPRILEKTSGSWCCRQGGTDKPTAEHLRDGCCPGQGLQTLDEILETDQDKPKEKNNCRWSPDNVLNGAAKELQEHLDRLRNNVRAEVPECNCFPADKVPPEPGSYYTHLGAARSLPELRSQVEERCGYKDKAVRIEKVLYTGKEGKTTQGCPLAKWVIRRSGLDEKILVVVKHRQGHRCSTAWIVVVIVAWEGVPAQEADRVYSLLTHKLNRFGLPTTRRCATNEPRTCACQGLDPNTCGASFSFGCSWSMYYNGCKYARSKTVRKFRLSVRSEEQEVEERLHILATLLSPLYQSLAPEAFHNQTQFESEASDCRLGVKPGRPFSGVTACFDFCAHSHRDLHNMNNGCTVVVSLTKHRSLSKPDDEQLHVLPLYIMDDSDENGSKEDQAEKIKSGAIENLTKFPCEIRVRSVPLQPCRRHGKKRGKEEDGPEVTTKKDSFNEGSGVPHGGNSSAPAAILHSPTASSGSAGLSLEMAMEAMEAQLQSSQVSSTVLDTPVSMYQNWEYRSSTGPVGPCQSWMVTDQMRWSEFNQSLSRCGERADPDSTTPRPTDMTWGSAAPHRTDLLGTFRNGSCKSNGGVPPSSKRIEPEDASSAGPSSYQNSLDAQSPSLDIPSSAFSPSPCSDYSPAEQKIDTKKQLSSWQLRQSRSWGEGPSAYPSSGLWDSFSEITSPFRITKTRHLAQNSDEQHYGSWDTRREAEDYSMSGGASKSLAFGAHSVKEESLFDNLKHPSDNAGYGPGAMNATNPFSCPMPGGSASYAYGSFPGYTPVFPDSKGFGSEWSESYMDSALSPHYTQYQGPPLYSGAGHPFGAHSTGFMSGAMASPYGYVPPAGWDLYGPPPFFTTAPEAPKAEPIGEVTDFSDNEECFKDPQMGGVAIALSHGSVLFECAKHEMHATTALRRPNRMHPTRISLVFYQHRNLNRPKHGWDEWEEKMRLRKLGVTTNSTGTATTCSFSSTASANLSTFASSPAITYASQFLMCTPTHTTTTWTTLFPMHPCMVTGPYQEGGTIG